MEKKARVRNAAGVIRGRIFPYGKKAAGMVLARLLLITVVLVGMLWSGAAAAERDALRVLSETGRQAAAEQDEFRLPLAADKQADTGRQAAAAERESEDAAPAQEQIDSGGRMKTARPSTNGRLHVEGAQLVDENGEAVQLRGASTHGLTWYPEFVEESMIGQLSSDWNSNLLRLAMYSTIYCGSEKEREESYALLKKGIDAAVAADMYVLVDWHILEDYDPNIHLEEARAFFDRISAEYADCPNILYEICNEPNQDTMWGEVRRYANEIIPVIRANSPGSVIIVGTTEYDRNLGDAMLRPLDYENIMYTLHFYAASHDEDLLGELMSAVEAGFPVFITECGICESSGDGTIDFGMARKWFRYLADHSIGYAVWSFSDKDESSAFFTPGIDTDAEIRDQDLTESGLWVRELLRGTPPEEIPAPAETVEKRSISRFRSWINVSTDPGGLRAVNAWGRIAAGALLFTLAGTTALMWGLRRLRKKMPLYEDIYSAQEIRENALISGKQRNIVRASLLGSTVFTMIYLVWRVCFSVPLEAGPLAVAGNLLLLAVEIFGFIEALILFIHMNWMKKYPLPQIPEDAWPDVDVFIATYNEPVELLQKTINGCRHMKYPDPSKVHIWICDDNRRSGMRALAQETGVGYFDRPDNSGAKAGNLNHALARTTAPYIVTFDADMIPKSDFLLKTIPYFIDAELRGRDLPPEKRRRLGLLQTPQCFYDPDVFQHALYSEKRAPNEQDFFYRTIEPAKTSTNSVIYGGSNTVLSREALEEIGGFFTGSITEDFATGLLIESAGFVSLALPEPLASGQTPHTFREYIQQRTRWGRGVIVTGKKLKIWRRKGLNLLQKLSYWSSVVYWYSPVKNMVYLLSPLLFAVFAIPVFKCSWPDLVVFCVPMYVMQDINLRICSGNTISMKWSGIYETCVMPHLLVPILKETAGITLSTFKVTDKSADRSRRTRDTRAMAPFIVLSVLSAVGIARVLLIMSRGGAIGLLLLLYWLIRNLYFFILSLFLIDGRDSDGEVVKVFDAEAVSVRGVGDSTESCDGITTGMTEHNLTVFLDEAGEFRVGSVTEVTIETLDYTAVLKGIVTAMHPFRNHGGCMQTIEILDFGEDRDEYLQILYDRIPTLPQTLSRDFGIITHLWQNIAQRVARTVRA